MKKVAMALLVTALLTWVAWPRDEQLDRLAAATPPGMVLVPGGHFLMGSDSVDEYRPQKKIYLKAFYIDICERSDPHTKLPVVGLLREEAQEMLAKEGKRLPTFAEWEKAARGTDGRPFPWGETFLPERAHVGGRVDTKCGLPGAPPQHLKPVGSYPLGASPYGCLDMIGNAWEWVADDHPGPPVRHIIRGGAYGYPDRHNRTFAYTLEDTGVT